MALGGSVGGRSHRARLGKPARRDALLHWGERSVSAMPAVWLSSGVGSANMGASRRQCGLAAPHLLRAWAFAPATFLFEIFNFASTFHERPPLRSPVQAHYEDF